MARVVIENLTKTFMAPDGGRIQAVNGLNLAVEDRELLVLVGPSGCGKTTTLRLIAGLDVPTEGTISIDGRAVNAVPAKDRDVAMVFQNLALYPHMTVHENLAFGLRLRGCSKAEIAERVREAAEILGLNDCLARRPEALSGGQRQRVAVGRAIVRRPKVFLFDEPLSNLDPQLRAQMRREIARLHTRLGVTMIYVTHDQVEAMTLGNRIAVMRDGVILQVADAGGIYERPASRFVAGFIGSPPMNFFRGTLVRNGDGMFFEEENAAKGFKVRLDDKIAARVADQTGRKVTLGLRPEDISERNDSNMPRGGQMVEAAAEVIEPMGPETHLEANTGAHSFVARVSPDYRAEPGQKVPLVFDLRKAHFFDPATEKALTG